MPILIHYQPNTRPLLPQVKAPLPTFAAGLTNVGPRAVTLRYERPDFVNQVRPTLATLPNLSSDLTKPAAPAVRLKYDPPTYIAPPKFNLSQAATPTVASWTPTIGPLAVELRYALSDFVIPTVTATVLGVMVAGLAEIGMRAVQALYTVRRTDAQVAPTLATLPTFLPAEPGAKAPGQEYSLADFVMGAAADIAGVFDFLQLTDPAPVAVELQYSRPADFVAPVRANIVPLAPPLAEAGRKVHALRYAIADIVAQVAPTLATLPALIFGLAEQAANALSQRYDKGGVTAPDKFNILAAAQTFLPGWLTTDGKLAVALRYLQSEAWVGQVQPTLATLPTLLYGLVEVLRRANPPTFSQGPAYVAPDKFNITAPTATFLPGWLTTDGKLAVALKYLQADAWAGQIVPTLATLPTLLYGLAEIMRPANPQTYGQAPAFTAPDKFDISVAAPAFLPAWLTTDGKVAVVVRYTVADFVNQVRATLVTLPALLSGIADPGINAQPQKYAAGSISAPEKVLSTPATIAGWASTPGLAAVLLRYAQASTFVAQVRPTLATLPVLLAGIATPAAPKVNLTYLQADAWISMQMNLPFIGGNPVVLLAGRTIPTIGILTGKVVQAIGITTEKILQVVGITGGKILQSVGIKSGKATT